MKRVYQNKHQPQNITYLQQQKQKQLIWRKNYLPQHIQNIQQIHFFIHDFYENDPYLKYQLHILISFFRTLFSYTFDKNIIFTTTTQILPSFDILYIILNHRELHNFIQKIPNIFVLVNTFDLHNSSFIFPQNIFLYSKAYRIIDLKYSNLQFYIPEVKNYTYYLPMICDYNETPTKVKTNNHILFYINHGNRSSIIYRLLAQKLEDYNSKNNENKKYTFDLYDHLNGEELFYESKVIVRIYDDINSYYDNILFSKCIHHQKICISEKCNDIYHENYYFDKIIFENKINIFDPSSIDNFISKIKLYIEDKEKIQNIKNSMIKQNVSNNINQFKLIFQK
jgi:hypothetical protein